MNKAGKVARKIGVALVGLPLFILGLILIPLPGPGILVSLLALLILSTEFDQAKPLVEKAKAELKKINDKYKDRKAEIDKKYK